MTIVSNNIKYLRRLNGLTQEQFSRRIGIKRSLLGAYEEARANPNLDNLQNMAKMFGTTVDALIKTDIRKIRETPGLNYQSNTNLTKQAPLNSNENTNVPPIATVIDKYFTDVPVGPVKNVNQEQQLPLIVDNPPRQENSITNNNQSTVNYTPALSQKQTEGIPFVNRNEVMNYVSKRSLNPYLSSLPQILIPNISTQNTRAFAANEEFPVEGAILIGEIVNKNTAIAEGQHHILICQDGRMLFRRVYDNTRNKGCYLLSSDEQQISSTEIPENQIVELLRFVAHIGYSVPKSNAQNPRIKNLIDELYRESGRS
ncbi:MAG: helix-turn-helix transcriptional regulator [Bacteroidota bacterium]